MPFGRELYINPDALPLSYRVSQYSQFANREHSETRTGFEPATSVYWLSTTTRNVTQVLRFRSNKLTFKDRRTVHQVKVFKLRLNRQKNLRAFLSAPKI